MPIHEIRFAAEQKMSPLCKEILKEAVTAVYGLQAVRFVKSDPGPGVLGFGVDSGIRTISPKQIMTASWAYSALVEALSLYKQGGWVLPEPVIIDVEPGMTWVYLERFEQKFDQPVCFDLENDKTGKIISISVTCDGVHNYVFTQDLLHVAKLLSTHYYVIGHGAKSDQGKIMRNYGIKVPIWFDTMLARHVMHPTGQGHFDLKSLGMKVLGLPDWEADIKKYTSKGKNADYGKIPHDVLVVYNGWDTYATWHLYEQWLPIVMGNPAFWYEMRWSNSLVDVEQNGVAIDVPYVERLYADLEIEKLAQMELLPQGVNPNSPIQLKKMFAEHGLRLASTDEKTLTEYADSKWSYLIDPLLEYRGIAKQQNTYAKAWLEHRDPATGLIHTTFNVHGTASARLSGSNPNLQNVPRDKRLRRAFVPRAPGRKWIEADYAQGELRVQAVLSGDADLIAAFQPDSPDFFDQLMPVAFPNQFPTLEDYLKYEDTECGGDEKDFRAKMKGVIYGLNFGRQAPAIAKALEMETEDAQAIIDNFMARYPVYAQWREDIMEAAVTESKRSLLTSWTNHSFEAEVITWRNHDSTQRSALSFLPQSTLAGLCTEAACEVNRRLKVEYPSAYLVLAVHDALYVDCPDELAGPVADLVAYEMTEAGRRVFGDVVLFATDAKPLPNWGGFE